MRRTTSLPDSQRDLLERPLFAHLATVGPNGAPNSSVMWFLWEDDRIKLTHTSTRQKYRNMQRDPRVALSIADPDDPYRFVEIRGTVEKIEDDDEVASFYKGLQHRYGKDYAITDADVRVIVTIRPEVFLSRG